MPFLKKPGWMKGLANKAASDRSSIKKQCSIDAVQDNSTEEAQSAQTNEQQSKPSWPDYLSKRKRSLTATAASLGIVVAVTLGGHNYVQANLSSTYHVIVDGQEIGMVSDPGVVDRFKEAKAGKLQKENPDVRMMLKTPSIEYNPERMFHSQVNDKDVLDQLDKRLAGQPVGVEVKIDGKVYGIVKDKQTAESVLENYKAKYMPKPKETGTVTILSSDAPKPLNTGDVVVQKMDFVQKVELNDAPIEKADLNKPEELLKKLETGGVQPTQYVVQPGDCLSCIAKKLNIPKQSIYERNSWIWEDQIKAGQTLDLTVLRPALSVRSVELVVENQEVQYDTVVQQDASLKEGITETVKQGKNGMKKLTVKLTKIDGKVDEEQVLKEDVVEPSVSAIVRKGTKVIMGEGTGNFAWPVIGASVTSTYGMRWGKMHKGVDLVGSSGIVAADNGKVIYTGYDSGYGNHIVIDHMNGYKTLYGHLSAINTSVGTIVEKGEKIGVMGSTGDSTGTHLHFEIHRSDALENPLKYLNR